MVLFLQIVIVALLEVTSTDKQLPAEAEAAAKRSRHCVNMDNSYGAIRLRPLNRSGKGSAFYNLLQLVKFLNVRLDLFHISYLFRIRS